MRLGIVLAVMACALFGAGTQLAQTVPSLQTDKPAYQAGETVTIVGSGFAPFEEVVLSVVHADGTAEGGMGHEPRPVTADETGGFTATWTIAIGDLAGNEFIVLAESASSGRVGPVRFERVVVVETNKRKYSPGETVTVEGLPFVPSEPVALEVTRADGSGETPEGHEPWTAGVDETGRFDSTLQLSPADSGSYFLKATGLETGLTAEVGINTLDPVTCPSNLNSCTANDVVTTVVSGTPVAGDSCESPGDTITLDLTVGYTSTANERYDLGVFVGINGKSVYNPLDPAAVCVGAAAEIGGGDVPGTGNLFVDLDPTGHAPNKKATSDTCGDLLQNRQVNWTVRLTVQCVPNANNQLVIQSCRVWEQNANHDIGCQTLQNAGTGSKCDCTPLTVADIPVPFGGTITVNKVVDPQADDGRFNLEIDGETAGTGAGVGHGGSTGAVTVSAGTSQHPGAKHYVGESGASGTSLGDYNSSIICTSGATTVGPQTTMPMEITVNKDENWICTITNTRKYATLALVKEVVGGSAAPTDWLCSAAGPTPISGAGGVAATQVLPGTYTLSESAAGTSDVSGYSAGQWSCAEPSSVGAAPATAVALDGSELTLGPGDNVICTITNTRDQGYLKITKVFDPLGSGFTGDFTIKYNCGAGDVEVALGSGESTTVGPFDTLTSCTVSEPTLPTAPPGWTFAAGEVSVSPAQILKGDADHPARITVTNTISKDEGYFKIKKVFDGTAAYGGDFKIDYVCTDTGATSGTVTLGAGAASVALGPIETHNGESPVKCTATEQALPSVIGYTWGAPSYSGDATITKGAEPLITVTNTIIPLGRIVVKKVAVPDAGEPKFNFLSNFTIPEGFTLKSGEVKESPYLLAGDTYWVSEETPDGWSLASATCSDGSPISAISLQPGEVVTCTFTNVKESDVTDTSFCQLPPSGFRLIYLQEPTAASANNYRLNSSNPGQFYYNVFYAGTPGAEVTLDIEIPYPFVTQGAVPIQVHDGLGFTNEGCYVPNPSLAGYAISSDGLNVSPSGSPVILLGDYIPKQAGSSKTVTVSGVVPDTGLLYVTIHLDYGLKKTTSWAMDLADAQAPYDALNAEFGEVLGEQSYAFSYTNGGGGDTRNPKSFNEFKKNPGSAGTATQKDTGNPKAGVRVELRNPTGTVVQNSVTDSDGFFMMNYKHTGKAAVYKVKLPDFAVEQSITLKANGFVIVNFEELP
jgi:hypothetical protein